MTVGVQAFRGKRLREARLARGLYKTALADLIGVTGTSITRYEEGIDKPQTEKVTAFARHLNFPVEFFLKPEWVEDPEVVFWRSHSAETQHARLMTEQRMHWVSEIFSFLEKEVDFPPINLPKLDLPDDFRVISSERIERAAEDLREAWRLRQYPIPDMILALENAGIPVVTIDMASDKQDGFCFKSRQLDRVFVGINTHNISAARARYDAAHELGHAVLHRDVSLKQLREPSSFKLLEQQAHRFAGAFLFPRAAFRTEVSAPTLDYFCALKRRWGMSIAAMVYRASHLGLIEDEHRSVLYRNMSRRRWRGALQEPYDAPSEMAPERPRMLRRGIEVLVKEGIMSRDMIRAELALPEKEIEHLGGLDQGFFDVGEVVSLAVPKREALRIRDVETGRILEFPKRQPSY